MHTFKSSLTALVVSMLCKEQGIMVLPSCVVYDIFILDRFDLSSYFTPQDSGDSDPPEEKAQSSPKKGQKVRKTKPVASSNFGVPSRECLIRVVVGSPLLNQVNVIQGLTIAFTAVIYQWRVSLNKGDVVKNDEKTNPANHIDGKSSINKHLDFS